MSRTRRRPIAWLLLAGLLIPTPSAGADEPTGAGGGNVDEGRDRFRKGIELFREHDYRAALIEFNRANLAAPSFRIQYNIGQTCLELKDYGCALTAFEEYLSNGGAEVPADRQQSVRAEVKRLGTLVGTLRIVVNRQGSEILVDDLVVGRSPLSGPLRVGAGRHRINATADRVAPFSRAVDVAGGDEVVVEIDLLEPVVAVAAAPASSPPAASTPLTAQPKSRTALWWGIGATSALAAGSIVVGSFALVEKGKLDRLATQYPVSADDFESQRGAARTLTGATDVLLIGTVVAAAVTTVAYFATRPRHAALVPPGTFTF